MKKNFRIALLIIAICQLSKDSLLAQSPGVNTTPTDHFVSFDGSWGWRFTTNVPLIISALGVYDEATNGLNSAHPLGFYSDAGALLASTTVPAGTGANLIGNFRYVNITPITIPAGTYRVAAVHLVAGLDNYGYDGLGVYHPNVAYIDGMYAVGPMLSFPNTITNVPNKHRFAGGNFLAATVFTSPTLGEWGLINFTLLVLSLATLFAVQRQKKMTLSNGMQMEVSDQLNIGSFIQDMKSNYKSYFLILASIIGVFTMILGVATKFFQYEMTTADIPGSIVASLIISLLAQFLLVNKNK